MNVQSALNAYKETNISEIEDATPHRLIELTFQDLKKNLLLIRNKLDQKNVKLLENKSIWEILKGISVFWFFRLFIADSCPKNV